MYKKTLPLIITIIVIIVSIMYVRKSKTIELEPITITVNNSYEILSIDRLITESDLIVIGSVKDIYASQWSTSNGERPEGRITPDSIIFTDMHFTVSQFIKGEQQNLRIRSLGGTVGLDKMIVDNIMPEIDKTYLLFLYLDKGGSTSHINPGYYWITGTGYQGLYEIIDDIAVSSTDKWLFEDLISYIQKVLSEKESNPTEVTEIPVELTEVTPSITSVSEETETPISTETITPTP
jgi:hypothetical protein